MSAFDHGCHAEIVRNGDLDACGRQAIGMRPDEEFGPWPACARHLPPAEYLGNGVWTVEHENLTRN